MPIDAKLLTLAQWLSPAFPTGAFAYSHGLETAVQMGRVRDADGLEAWLRDCLTDGSGRSDAIWLRLSHDAKDISELNALARAFAISSERLREADRQGSAFVAVANAVWGLSLPDLLLPIAVGQAVRQAELDLEEALALYLQSFVTNLVLASIRLAPIGQTEGQGVIHRLQAECIALVRETRGTRLDDIHGNAFLSDITAMRHETLEPRLFQS